MIPGVRTEHAKKITTYDLNRQENGIVLELYKDGTKTTQYMTTLKVGGFKGYHLQRIRSAYYVILKGQVKIILYQNKIREEYIMDAREPSRLFIPKDIATGLLNIGEEEAWLVSFPNPAYDPAWTDEQVEYTEEELEQGIVK